MRRIFFDYNFLNRGHQVYSYHSQDVIQFTRIIVNYETFLLRGLSVSVVKSKKPLVLSKVYLYNEPLRLCKRFAPP